MKSGKKYYLNRVLPFIRKIEGKTEKYLKKGKFERAMDGISVSSCILYRTNQFVLDEKLESYILKTAERFEFSPKGEPHKNKVLFYDGFGFDYRGLAGIYLKSLVKKYDVIYCTLKRFKGCIPNILSVLGNSKVYYIDEKSYTQRVKDVSDIIKCENPEFLFIYVYPFDVATVTAFTAYKGTGKRFMINLTDHAFWIGNNSYDRLIEFRDYGAHISQTGRKVEPEKTVKVPMYPDVKKDVDFEGFPFDFDEKTQKFFFSGGGLYKTFGGDGLYYKTVKEILNACPDVVFWYAGEGDTSKIDELKKEFPKRVFYSTERKDLFALLKKCAFYLSTYPVCGNMMTQYAAAAGVVPLTLKNGNDGTGTLKNQSELGYEFDDVDELIDEAKKLVCDDKYRASKQKIFESSVIGRNDFENALFGLLDGDKKIFEIGGEFVSDDDFIAAYLENVNPTLIAECVAKKGRKNFFDFPVYYLKGCFIKVIKKLLKKS
ncbi:MAG: hypothetical protein SPL13_06415 [Clostridia bacterium]|nr:hypothetical protein [Clostridia bacterium]